MGNLWEIRRGRLGGTLAVGIWSALAVGCAVGSGDGSDDPDGRIVTDGTFTTDEGLLGDAAGGGGGAGGGGAGGGGEGGGGGGAGGGPGGEGGGGEGGGPGGEGGGGEGGGPGGAGGGPGGEGGGGAGGGPGGEGGGGAGGACEVQPEVCDDVDNDCDGAVDEALPATPCYTGSADTRGVGACRNGTQSCVAGVLTGCEGEVRPEVERCDGLDTDCNGVVDDVAGRGAACQVGLGACQAAGALQCGPDGALVCDARASAPGDEACDGIDNDCDGMSDEGGVCPLCANGVLEPGEDCDDGNMVNGDGCSIECRLEGPAPVGSFRVDDGPDWGQAAATSCVAACAQLFGGAADDYACSTTPDAIDRQAWASAWGHGDHCQGGVSGSVPDDRVLPGEGEAYNCGAIGCSLSAYVSDHCQNDSVNYCFLRPEPPCPGEIYGGVCLVHLSAECVLGSAAAYCADQGGEVITFAEFQAMVAGGWVRPNSSYHTVAVTEYADCPDGFANVGIPGFGDLTLWVCGEAEEYCNRAMACVLRD